MALRTSLRFGLTAISFWPFIPIAGRAATYGRLVFELASDARVPWTRKVVLGIAAAYVVSPIDLVPDWVPFIHICEHPYDNVVVNGRLLTDSYEECARRSFYYDLPKD